MGILRSFLWRLAVGSDIRETTARVRSFLEGAGAVGVEIGAVALRQARDPGAMRDALRGGHDDPEYLALVFVQVAMVDLLVRGSYADPAGGSNDEGREMDKLWERSLVRMEEMGYRSSEDVFKQRMWMQVKLAEQGLELA